MAQEDKPGMACKGIPGDRTTIYTTLRASGETKEKAYENFILKVVEQARKGRKDRFMACEDLFCEKGRKCVMYFQEDPLFKFFEKGVRNEQEVEDGKLVWVCKLTANQQITSLCKCQ